MAESNGSLLPGLWRNSLHVTCGLTACTLGSAPGPTLGNEYGKNCKFLLPHTQWCIAKNGGGYTQRGVAKGLKVPCLFMITEVSIRCPKNPDIGIRRIPAYTPQYTTAHTGCLQLLEICKVMTK